jgi:hypothetical protein
MANPTTNYGFVLPTPTDLVTDLPADFDVALQGVDTRLKALQPGTTLGDLAYSSATANTNTRLGIGSNAQVLTVAGGVPTWATPSGGTTLVGCRLTKSANQSLTASTETAITFDGESWDTNGFHDNVTNNTRITIPTGYTGKYQLSGEISIAPMVGNYYVLIKKNGSVLTYTVVQYSSNSSLDTAFTFSQLLSLTAADYVELFLYQASGSAKNCQTTTSLGINYLGA